MIGTNDEIKELLKNERRDRLSWPEILESRIIPIYLNPCSHCVDSIGDLFGDDLQESSQWIKVEEGYRNTYHSFTGYYYKGELFLVSDCYSDGEDDWDEDDEIVDRAIAAQVLGIIMDAVKDYYVKQLLGVK
jgi:hypothetical protein